MEVAPGLAFWPGFAIALAVYGTNMFGDAMRDVLDPRLRGELRRLTFRHAVSCRLKAGFASGEHWSGRDVSSGSSLRPHRR